MLLFYHLTLFYLLFYYIWSTEAPLGILSTKCWKHVFVAFSLRSCSRLFRHWMIRKLIFQYSKFVCLFIIFIYLLIYLFTFFFNIRNLSAYLFILGENNANVMSCWQNIWITQLPFFVVSPSCLLSSDSFERAICPRLSVNNSCWGDERTDICSNHMAEQSVVLLWRLRN